MEANLCGKHNANVAEIKELNEKPSILNSASYTGGPDGGKCPLKYAILQAVF